ncbi:MAG: flagellar basal body rod protein FlgB [Firmicutes bacterium]|nr:flagellar basal body rod protein FlgB [Bacillota bacterium]
MFDLVSSNPMIQAMDRSMSLANQRLGLIAGNMANLDTPGYRAQDFNFQAALKDELNRLDGNNMPTHTLAQTHPRHFPIRMESPRPAATTASHPAYERNDGNDVSLDREAAALSRTQLTYQLSASFAQQELRKIYQVIRDGRSS